MNAIPRHLLSVALAAVISTTFAVQAQDADAPTDAELVAEATVPTDRLAERYASLAGSEEAAAELVSQLRTGEDFTVVEEVTTTVTNDDGTTTTSTELVERTITNTTGPMGYGEVNITLSLAQALVDAGAYPDLQSALSGVETTVVNADGTSTVMVEGGVLALRADGMGWGQIAQELGFKLGHLVSASNRGTHADGGLQARADGQARGESARAGASANARVDTGRPASAGRPQTVERPQLPTRPERPERPERPQRPERPERGGGRG